VKAMKSLWVVAVGCMLSHAAAGADGTRISARDVFGIAVDEQLADCIRPADTNGMVLVRDWKGGYCFGRAFCGIEPSKFELGEPDEKGRRFVRLVEGGALITNRVELTDRCAKLSNAIKGFSNLKRVAGFNVSSDDLKSAAWTGVGQDEIPFAVTLSAERQYPNPNFWHLAVRVMDYGRFATMHEGVHVPEMREADREKRLERNAKKRVGRCARMMKEKAYSGRWACKAKGYDCIAFCFDKSGLGFFDMVLDGYMHSQSVAGGWFYWTADEKGEITIHAPRQKEGPKVFKLKYDYERNMMVPDMNGYPFSGRVIPLAENPSCEMRFVNDTSAAEIARVMPVEKECDFEEMFAEAEKFGVRREVPSLVALQDLAEEQLDKRGGLMLHGVDQPTIWISESRTGSTNGATVSAIARIERMGDPEAPEFAFLGKRAGPKIAGKKAEEVFFDDAELRAKAKALGGAVKSQALESAGFLSAEKWHIAIIDFKSIDRKSLRTFLEYVAGHYKFPATVVTGK